MSINPLGGVGAPGDEVSPDNGGPSADEDVHVQLAHHGFFVSGDSPHPEGDDELARTMLSVIESLLATAQTGEQSAAKTDDATTDG